MQMVAQRLKWKAEYDQPKTFLPLLLDLHQIFQQLRQ